MGGHKHIGSTAYEYIPPPPPPPTIDWNTAVKTYYRDENDIIHLKIKFASPMDITKTPPLVSMNIWINHVQYNYPSVMSWLDNYNLIFEKFYEYPIVDLKVNYTKSSPAITNIAAQEYASKSQMVFTLI